jgi:hypothetical protein
MPLVRISHENGLFTSLIDQWRKQCEEFGEDISDFAAPHLQHAEKICCETPQDKRYGIYANQEGDDFTFLMHINQARLPGTKGSTLRVLWILLAPRFDYGDIGPDELAEIATGIIHGAVTISRTDMPSQHVKIHLNNTGDRRFFVGVAYGLRDHAAFEAVEIKGNWIHMNGTGD